MRIGGWWRLWIGLSALWSAGAVFVSYSDRPSRLTISREVSDVCNVEEPMSSQDAANALEMRNLLGQLRVADANGDEKKARLIAKEIVRRREVWGKRMGKHDKYSIYRATDPHGVVHTAVAPAGATNEVVVAAVNSTTKSLNNWAKFPEHCVELLIAHSNGKLERSKYKTWLASSVTVALSFPLLTLLLGSLVGWIWRGFRPRKDRI